MPFGRKSPLEALALPGVMLAYKYSQFRQRRREAASRRVTERELSALHHKIVSKAQDRGLGIYYMGIYMQIDKVYTLKEKSAELFFFSSLRIVSNSLINTLEND